MKRTITTNGNITIIRIEKDKRLAEGVKVFIGACVASITMLAWLIITCACQACP